MAKVPRQKHLYYPIILEHVYYVDHLLASPSFVKSVKDKGQL